MNIEPNEKLRKLLRAAMPAPDAAELQRDLWPAMLRKLDERRIYASWLDWALAAVAVSSLFVFPDAILALLYHV
jgi:hypothetical protein